MTGCYLSCGVIRPVLPERSWGTFASCSLLYDGRLISLERGRQRSSAFGIPLVQSRLRLSSLRTLTVDGSAE